MASRPIPALAPAAGRADEAALVAGVRAGDPEAYRAIFPGYYPALCGFVLSYLHDRAAAEEVVQELFGAIWERRTRWAPAEGVRPYLFGAARNRALDALRHMRTVARVGDLGFDLDNWGYEYNLGKITNNGVELVLTGRLVETRPLVWDVGLNASVNHNKLLAIDPSALDQYNNFLEGMEQDRVGYPLNGMYGIVAPYADLNHDGIIEYPTEIVTPATSQQGSELQYIGPSLPTKEVSLTTHIGMLRNVLAVGALFDYRGGYVVYNQMASTAAADGEDVNLNVLSDAPLWEKARDAGQYLTNANADAGFLEPGDFVRFRELSLTYTLPVRVVHRVHLQALSLTGAVRNLALWTRYTGADPEVRAPSSVYSSASGTYSVDNNLRVDAPGATVPLTRDWFVRLNLGL